MSSIVSALTKAQVNPAFICYFGVGELGPITLSSLGEATATGESSILVKSGLVLGTNEDIEVNNPRIGAMSRSLRCPPGVLEVGGPSESIVSFYDLRFTTDSTSEGIGLYCKKEGAKGENYAVFVALQEAALLAHHIGTGGAPRDFKQFSRSLSRSGSATVYPTENITSKRGQVGTTRAVLDPVEEEDDDDSATDDFFGDEAPPTEKQLVCLGLTYSHYPVAKLKNHTLLLRRTLDYAGRYPDTNVSNKTARSIIASFEHVFTDTTEEELLQFTETHVEVRKY